MPRTPPEPATPADRDGPHRHREIAESFGGDAERYDRARPGYPQALADTVVALAPGPQILDVGIGTGLSALPFREAGCSVLGVEVDARMAAVARRRGFPVEVAGFEHWDGAGRLFDAVVAGQTWHWIDPVVGAAAAAAVLRPRGVLAAFWNIGDPTPEVAAAFAEVYRRVDTGLPFTPWTAPALTGYARILASAIDGIRQCGGFGEPEQRQLDWQATVTRDQWLDQVPTAGGHQRIPPEKLDALLAGMAAVIDAAGGSFSMSYATVVITALRASA